MAHDAELDRLKAAQDTAFQRKQRAYEAMDTAWKRRSAAREALDRAHAAKQNAYDVQNSAWEYYQSVRQSNGPRIDSLNDRQERAFQNMKDAFDRASSAHDMRDGASARMYADQGHSYKAESQGYVAERRRLVQEIRDAKERHESTRPAFQYAKSQFDDAKRTHDRARDDHQRKQEEFKRAKADFDAAVAAFKKRLETVRAESQRRRQDKRSIAERAGVPFQYLNNVWVSRQGDVYNIYFGGVGKPNGLGHGHYVMDRSGNVTYRRDPFDPHGAHNFTEPVYWHKVKMSYDKDSRTFQTDNYIGIVGDTGQKSKAHIAVNADGEIVFVRDLGGEVLYDRKNGRGHLPDDLDWSK